MLGLIIAIGLTLFLGISLIVVLVGGKSKVASRLVEVASYTPDTYAPAPPTTSSRSETFAKLFSFLGPIRGFIGLVPNPDLANRLSLAGYREPAHSEIFLGAKMLMPIAGALGAAFYIKGSDMIFWLMALAAFGFFAPDLWLSRAISKRREQIRLSLPDALDLLVICMEAGLGMDQALMRVGREMRISHPQLSEEFLLINLEQRAGKPRIDAWRNMAERTGLETVRSFVNMLVQTERFGTPISKSLGAFADGLRVSRRQQAEEQAAKTTIKMIFPLVLFIFPSMFIVLLAPAIIRISQTLDQVFQ